MTLVVTPVVYSLLDDLAGVFRRLPPFTKPQPRKTSNDGL
jgi:hypothetical protein